MHWSAVFWPLHLAQQQEENAAKVKTRVSQVVMLFAISIWGFQISLNSHITFSSEIPKERISRRKFPIDASIQAMITRKVSYFVLVWNEISLGKISVIYLFPQSQTNREEKKAQVNANVAVTIPVAGPELTLAELPIHTSVFFVEEESDLVPY